MVPSRKLHTLALLCTLQAAASSAYGQSTLRRAMVGDKLEPFALTSATGEKTSYRSVPGRVFVLLFLAAPQRQSENALERLSSIVLEFRRSGQEIDLVGAVSSEESRRYIELRQKEAKLEFPLHIDTDYALWGSLGIIALPTVIVVDREGVIRWINAGYGHDFTDSFQSELSQALGLEPRKARQPGQAKVLLDNAVAERAQRHLKVAEMLAEKRNVEGALSQAKEAAALLPASVEIQIIVARFTCQAGRAEEALAALARIKAVEPRDKAEISVVAGWAYRELGNDALAEKMLRASLDINPRSVRAMYELGKVYERRGENDHAMEMYRRALAAQFGETVPTAAPVQPEQATVPR